MGSPLTLLYGGPRVSLPPPVTNTFPPSLANAVGVNAPPPAPPVDPNTAASGTILGFPTRTVEIAAAAGALLLGGLALLARKGH